MKIISIRDKKKKKKRNMGIIIVRFSSKVNIKFKVN